VTADLLRFTCRLTNPLFVAGSFLVTGFLATRRVFRDRLFGQFIFQMASFAGLTIMLVEPG
jgi:hypothetical protein